MNIKTWLIHALGGVTADESRESDANAFGVGEFIELTRIKEHADKLYGEPAEEWSRHMYEFIEQEMDELMDSGDEE